MSSLANLNDQENLTLTQISYSSNMLSEHHGKTFARIAEIITDKGENITEEEEDFLEFMNQFPEGENPFANYKVEATANNPSSGFGAVAFTDDQGNTGISYRGTDGAPSKKSANDWVDNAISGLTGDSTQCREAEAFFERYSDPNGNNYLYGHSKGGNLSEYVFVRNHKKIKGMHLLNPQPLNPWSLTPEQLAAINSDKVDIVVVEGDYVWFVGLLPSLGNVRVVESNGGDSHFYWSIKFKDGSVLQGEIPGWQLLVLYGVGHLSPILQGGGAIFDFLYDCVVVIVDCLKKGWEKCQELIAWTCDKLEKLGNKFKEIVADVKDFFNKVVNNAKNWYNRNLNAGYKYASANPQIVADTYKLRQYAQRLQKVNGRISRVDGRLDSLYWRVGLLDLWNLMQADILTGYSWRLNRCVSYLNETATDFENVESALLNNL